MGTQELIIVFAIIFLLFGASRLPQLGSSLGSAIRNFKKGFAGADDANETKKNPDAMAAKSSTGAAEASSDKVGAKDA
ncbi:MAG: twin-arginine translocase TatA/TatE family subunit [Myxococcaceae bacterium]|nr:twin-arginine translocase TatA/TatE family subunit [Myxococcaceae bacterium]